MSQYSAQGGVLAAEDGGKSNFRDVLAEIHRLQAIELSERKAS